MTTGWDIANAVAQMISAVATFAAVIVALYLARQQNAARLTISAQSVGIVTPGVSGSDEGFFLRISMTNAGLRDVTVTSFGWRIGRFRRAHFVQLLPLNAMSATLPVKLAPSEEATFLYPWDQYVRNSATMRAAFGTGWLGRRRARTALVVAALSTGEVLDARVDRLVADKLFNAPR